MPSACRGARERPRSTGACSRPLASGSCRRVPQGQAAVITHCRPPCPTSPVSSPAPSLLLAAPSYSGCPGPTLPAGGCRTPWGVANPSGPWLLPWRRGPSHPQPRVAQCGKVDIGGSDAQLQLLQHPAASPGPQALGPWLALSSSSPEPGRQRVSVNWGRWYLPGPPQGPRMGSTGVELRVAPTHAWPSSLSPGAEWRQPSLWRLAGAGQGLAPRPGEEQEGPGRAGRR